MKRFQNKNNKNKSRNANHADDDNEKYVIVVSNVENDFAKIHQNQLVSFCSLNPSLQKYNMQQYKKKQKKEGEAEQQQQQKQDAEQDGDVTAVADNASEAPMHCCYQLNCRQETRTAELQVYADSANTSIASIFNPKRHQQQQQHRKRGREEAEENKEDGEETLLVQEDLRNLANDETSTGADDDQYMYNSLTSMVMQLQRKPYFHSFLNMYVTLPGYAEGDALVLEQPSASHEEGEEEKEEGEKKKQAKPVVRIKQFDGTQNELVSCPLQLSQARPQDAIAHLLADLPGFVSLFPLHQTINNNNTNNNNRRNPRGGSSQGVITKSFRIVFQNKKYLFQAKHLLDQFELEGNLRVYLKLNDNMAKEEEVFRREEEEKGGLGSNHPISVIDDVNAEPLPF